MPTRSILQRLFSMFPNGSPGAGLLLLRAITGIFAIIGGVREILSAHHLSTFVLDSLAIAAALLLLTGLWTPLAGLSILLIELLSIFSRTAGIEDSVLLGAMGAALALLGPGSYSVDARRYGRKRIRIPSD